MEVRVNFSSPFFRFRRAGREQYPTLTAQAFDRAQAHSIAHKHNSSDLPAEDRTEQCPPSTHCGHKAFVWFAPIVAAPNSLSGARKRTFVQKVGNGQLGALKADC